MRVLIITVCLLAALFCGLELAHSAEFTLYDDRSSLHFGASALINSSCNGFGVLVTGKAPPRQRAYCAFITTLIGLGKEFGVDSYPDYGDIMWNLAGVAVSDQAFVYLFPVEDGAGVGVTINY
jgi:hypothetical protein